MLFALSLVIVIFALYILVYSNSNANKNLEINTDEEEATIPNETLDTASNFDFASLLMPDELYIYYKDENNE